MSKMNEIQQPETERDVVTAMTTIAQTWTKRERDETHIESSHIIARELEKWPILH